MKKQYATFRVFLFLLLGGMVAEPAFAQADSALHLQDTLHLGDAVHHALLNRLEIQAADQRLRTTEKEIKAAQLRYIPQVNAQADIKYNAILATSIVPIGALNIGNPTDEVVAVRFGTQWANGAGLNLRQTIFDPTIKGARALALINGRMMEVQRAQTMEAITMEVVKAYYGVLIAEADAQNGDADMMLVAQRLRDLRLRMAEGRALPIDVESAVIDSATAALRLADLQRNVADWRAVLAYQMGLGADAGKHLHIADQLVDLLSARLLQTALPVLGKDYELKGLQVAQARQLQANEKAGYKPDLSIVGFLGANHYSNAFDPWKGDKWFPTSFIGLNLSVPLTEGFIRQQRVQRLGLLAEVAQIDQRMALQQLSLDFERANIALEGAVQALQAQDALVQLAIQKWAITQARAAEDRATPTEVMAALTELQRAQTTQLRRTYEVLLADLEMRRLCGLLEF